MINTKWHFVNPAMRVVKHLVVQRYFFVRMLNDLHFDSWFNLLGLNSFSNFFHNPSYNWFN